MTQNYLDLIVNSYNSHLRPKKPLDSSMFGSKLSSSDEKYFLKVGSMWSDRTNLVFTFANGAISGCRADHNFPLGPYTHNFKELTHAISSFNKDVESYFS
jgi:hypothetical protein